jgi:hypothetical protein
MYLSGVGLQPADPAPFRREVNRSSLPEYLGPTSRSEVSSSTEAVDGFPCLVLRARRDETLGGKNVQCVDTLWLDPKRGYTPRKWEQTRDGSLWTRWTHHRLEEVATGCWLPAESLWTIAAPAWAAADFRGKPAFSYRLTVRRIRVNDVGDQLFEPKPRD